MQIFWLLDFPCQKNLKVPSDFATTSNCAKSNLLSEKIQTSENFSGSSSLNKSQKLS